MPGWKVKLVRYQPNPQPNWGPGSKAPSGTKRKREIEPTLTLLRDTLLEPPADAAERHAQARMKDMLELIELSTGWFDEIQRLPPETLERLMRLGSKVQKVLSIAGKLGGGATR